MRALLWLLYLVFVIALYVAIATTLYDWVDTITTRNESTTKTTPLKQNEKWIEVK